MLMAKSTGADSLAHLLDAPPSFWEAEGLQRGRKLQTLTFRYKHGSGKSVFVSAMMMSRFDFDYGWQVL